MGEKIAFIGAGKVSTALGLYLKNRGLEIQGYFSRRYESAEKAAGLTGSRPYTSLPELIADSRMIWITTPDDQIPFVVRQISAFHLLEKNGKLLLHASGAHTLDVLDPLKEVGYHTACAHPLMAFNNGIEAQQRLKSVWFAIEESEKSCFSLVDFFKTCGNRVFTIEPNKKALYHAAASVLSNYLVTLWHLSHEIFEKSGMAKEDIQEAAWPLLESVVNNLKGRNSREALTGPIKRGDARTVEKHLAALQAYMPETIELYRLLGRKTMQMLGDCSLEKIVG